MCGLTLQAAASTEKVTIEQLERLLHAAQGKTDLQVASDLSDLELTERLTDVHLSELQTSLPGPKSIEKLTLLADASAFLDLPASELPATPNPDYARQVLLLRLARNYVADTILKLPNFFATRETTNYVSTLADTKINSVQTIPYKPFEEVDASSVTVLYRDGREMAVKGDKYRASSKEVRTRGEFGPILIVVLNDAIKGHLTWSHWEKSVAGTLAVFQYQVPLPASHYLVDSPGLNENMRYYPAYHGEVALNPTDGSILRLTIVPEMKAGDPMTSADLMVDYGSVGIGGKNYICPIKSVALSQVRVVHREWDDQWRSVERNSLGPPQIYLNEVRFTRYHLFRSEARVLTGKESEAEIQKAMEDNAPFESSSHGAPASPAGAEENGEPIISETGWRFSVSDLERGISHDKTYGASDVEIAKHLSRIQLSERLSDARLARLEAELSSPEERDALDVLFDLSAFLDLPEADVPARPAPDKAAQASMLTRASDYVSKMPLDMAGISAKTEINCFARQSTDGEAGYEPFRKVKALKVNILGSNGPEAIENAQGNDPRVAGCDVPDTDGGALGPLLAAILGDAAGNSVDWSHWELAGSQLQAVFTYSVPQESSKCPFIAGICETRRTSVNSSSRPDDDINPPYHGEIAIDPQNGSILRLTFIADLGPDNPVRIAETRIDFADFNIGGARRVFPKRSAWIYELRNDRNGTAGAQHDSGDPPPGSGSGPVYLKDALFLKYQFPRTDRQHRPE